MQVVPPVGWGGQSGRAAAVVEGMGKSVGEEGDGCEPVEGRGECVWGGVEKGEVEAAGNLRGCWP